MTEFPVTTSAIDTVFARLLADIVSGTHAEGSRLPAERELAKQLGASRPTLREALRRLGEWHLVAPRRGSGVVVRPMRDWAFEVIPAYLQVAKPPLGQPARLRVLADTLALRRSLTLDVLRHAAARIPATGTAAARAAMHRAWAERDNPAAFAREELEVMRAIVIASDFWPGLWLLNRISEVWHQLAGTLRFAIAPPADYLPTYTAIFDAIESGQPQLAHDTLANYLARHDDAIVSLLHGKVPA